MITKSHTPGTLITTTGLAIAATNLLTTWTINGATLLAATITLIGCALLHQADRG